ncbi:MAG: hypothetical protein ACKN82_01425, partial [Pirellula sp.]
KKPDRKPPSGSPNQRNLFPTPATNLIATEPINSSGCPIKNLLFQGHSQWYSYQRPLTTFNGAIE